MLSQHAAFLQRVNATLQPVLTAASPDPKFLSKKGT